MKAVCLQNTVCLQRAWDYSEKVVLVPAKSLMSYGMEASRLTSLVSVSSPRDGASSSPSQANGGNKHYPPPRLMGEPNEYEVSANMNKTCITHTHVQK